MANNLDTLIAELSYFNIVLFSETSLHDEASSSNELLFSPSFPPLEREVRYGGVTLCQKQIVLVRIHDVELNNLERIGLRLNLVI